MRLTMTAVIALFALVASLALVACGDSDDDSTTATTNAGTTEEAKGDGKPTAPAIPTIVVRDGKPVGGVEELEYDAGEEVRFKVRSNVADEIHVHGYDVERGGAGGRLGDAQLLGRHRRDLRGRAARQRGTDRGAARQPVSLLVFAHALVAREDLPIPAWLFAWGASIVLIVSFFALSVGWREPRFEQDRWRPLGAGLSRALLGLPTQVLCGVVGVFLLGLTVYAGLRGTEAPDRNFALTFIFVTLLARLPAPQRLPRRRLSPVQPLAGGWARRRGWLHRARRTASRPPRLPGAARPLAGGDRSRRLRLAGDRLRRQRRRSGRPLPRARGDRGARLQRLHAGDDGDLRGREVVRTRRGLLRLLRHVLPARRLRGARGPDRPSPPASRRRPGGRPCPARPRS